MGLYTGPFAQSLLDHFFNESWRTGEKNMTGRIAIGEDQIGVTTEFIDSFVLVYEKLLRAIACRTITRHMNNR